MQVGRYEVQATIGTGAYSRVARGYDPLIGRYVAIKLFSPSLAQGQARERFFREARVVGQISHPSIVALHDMGIEESRSTPYLIMDLVEGQSLEQIIAKGSLPFQRACAWAAEMAKALGVAHRKGIIHGDVKPANILISTEGRVKVTDFGMARLANHDTLAAPLLGTPAYWCPEQILGKTQDSRSDLFSFGVVFYEMLTGVNPFAAESLQGICSRVLSSSPVPPSQNNPSLPAALNEVVAACLQKDPLTRIATAELLAEKLYPFTRASIPTAVPVVLPAVTLRSRAARLLRSA
ncbi:MAG TPA: serine/threonine-protein kinase [Candidatus Eremiobacteraceae bacterium]|nr:serine/threonine-protein kinase [Candidatus Eremiobacteraceae bacterium]